MTSIFCLSLVLLLLQYTTISLTDVISGIYVDNGYDETMIVQAASDKEKRYIELELMAILDLPEKPRVFSDIKSQMDRSDVQFIMGMRSQQGESNVITHNSFQIRLCSWSKELDILRCRPVPKAAKISDDIVTFLAHRTSSRRRGLTLSFDLSKIPDYKKLLTAELRLFRSLAKSKRYRVSVWQIIDKDTRNSSLIYLSSKILKTKKAGWIVLNVAKLFLLNHGKRKVDVHVYWKVENETRGDTLLHDVGFVGPVGESTEVPFMAAYYKGDAIPYRRKRNTMNSLLHRSQRKSPYGQRNFYNSPGICRMQSLYVRFDDLNWKNIIFPEGIQMNFCVGECNFPLHVNMNATNYAILQTYVNLIKPSIMPKAHCVPTKMAAVDIIYSADDDKIFKRKYENFVAEMCGCH